MRGNEQVQIFLKGKKVSEAYVGKNKKSNDI